MYMYTLYKVEKLLKSIVLFSLVRFKRPKEVIADIAQADVQQGHFIDRNVLNAYIELSLCRKNDFRNF